MIAFNAREISHRLVFDKCDLQLLSYSLCLVRQDGVCNKNGGDFIHYEMMIYAIRYSRCEQLKYMFLMNLLRWFSW